MRLGSPRQHRPTDFLERHADYERRVKRLEQQAFAGERAYAKRATRSELAEWLSYYSTVDKLSFTPGTRAWSLIDAEAAEKNIDVLRRIRNARARIGAMQPLVNWEWNVPQWPGGGSWGISGAGNELIVSLPRLASPPATLNMAVGEWDYPVVVPGHPQYHYVKWLGDVGPFTLGKYYYHGYEIHGAGLAVERGIQPDWWAGVPKGGTGGWLSTWTGGWVPDDDYYVLWGFNVGGVGFGMHFGFGRGNQFSWVPRAGGDPSHPVYDLIEQNRGYQEYPNPGELAIHIGPGSRPESRNPPFVQPTSWKQQMPAIGEFHSSYYEEPYELSRGAVAFPTEWLRSAGPPRLSSGAARQGPNSKQATGSPGSGPRAAFTQATFADVQARGPGAVADLGLGDWVDSALVDAPDDPYDHGWVPLTEPVFAQSRTYYIVRHGWVNWRGYMKASTINLPGPIQPPWSQAEPGPWLCPGGPSRQWYVVRVQGSSGAYGGLTADNYVSGDVVHLDPVSWPAP